MITIKMYRKDKSYELDIQGHANYDASGKDIVCSAVSILYYTLANSIININDEKKVKSCKIKGGEGNASIELEASDKGIQEISTILKTVVTGFMLLQDNYKDNVKLVIAGNLFL